MSPDTVDNIVERLMLSVVSISCMREVKFLRKNSRDQI